MDAAGHLKDLLGDLREIDRCVLISIRADAQLPILIPSAGEESTDVIDEERML